MIVFNTEKHCPFYYTSILHVLVNDHNYCLRFIQGFLYFDPKFMVHAIKESYTVVGIFISWEPNCYSPRPLERIDWNENSTLAIPCDLLSIFFHNVHKCNVIMSRFSSYLNIKFIHLLFCIIMIFLVLITCLYQHSPICWSVFHVQ